MFPEKFKEKISKKNIFIFSFQVFIFISFFSFLVYSIFNYSKVLSTNIAFAIVISAFFILLFSRYKKKEFSIIFFILFLIFIVLFFANFLILITKVGFYFNGPSISEKDLRSGDLLFLKQGKFGNFIPGSIGHVAVYVERNNGSYVIESLMSKGGIVRKTPYDEFVEGHELFVGKFKNLSQENREKAIEWIEGKVGLPYNYFFFSKKENSTSYYCSELIWAGYKKVGIDLENEKNYILSFIGGIFPQEIYLDDDLIIFELERD